jgi:hypothetical protein
VTEAVQTGNRFKEIASEGETVCFVGNADGREVYCNDMTTGLQAASVDVHNSHLYIISSSTVAANMLEIAQISTDDSMCDLSMSAIQIDTGLPRVGALAAGSLKTCVILRTNNDLYCADGDLLSSTSSPPVWTQPSAWQISRRGGS